jgi:hypothetical protein
LRTRRRRRLTVALTTFALVLIVTSILSVAGAINLPIIGGLNGGVNDLGTVGLGLGQTPTAVVTQHNDEPPLTATPAPTCGPNSKPEPGIDGRVPAGSADNGLWCNIQLIAHQGTSGGFKVFRYVDAAGHVCAFYDTALLFPTNAINPGGASLGVAVLNMADPAHPVQTDTLTQLPMLTPHESLNLNPARGLLAAVDGNPATSPGLFAIYDVHSDCLHPTLDAVKLVARFGHESGFSPDGKTFYATATAIPGITAIDVSNPKDPHAIWQGNVTSHGMTLSDNGDTAYVADPSGALTILNVSQIQDRKPNPQATEISRLTWKSVSIPQNAIPFTEDGHPYLLEFDEYTAGTLNPTASRDVIGAARIIDIANPAHPFVVSNMRLAVDQPAAHKAAGNDPGTLSPAQGYAAHYCNIPTEVNPQLVACSFIASGLRVFNISDILHPREVAYFVAPTKPNTETGYSASDYAMSKPAFDVARHDIWYTDGGTGFYVLHVTNGAWPASTTPPTTPPPTTCSHEGQLSGSSLGPVALGMTRGRVNSVGCLKHDRIQVKYQRSKVVLALTANRHYALKGARAGTKLARVKGKLRPGRGVKIGRNTWYLVPAGRSRGVLEVRHGVIEKIGIASKPPTASRGAARKLLAGVS